jgi:L-fuconolactonase
MPIVDAHQHYWDPTTGDYPWLEGPFAPIARPFRPADLEPELDREGIGGTVLVQTWNNLGETWEYIGLAAATPSIAGVVGWADLTDPALRPTLQALKTSPNGRWLVGLRHLVQDEPDPDWLLRDDVRRGLGVVADFGLVYDLVIKPPQLPAALRTVADFPQLRFVIDHIAKPDIKAGAIAPWADLMRQFRPHRDHVWCKLSGMVTEADWGAWTPDTLKPYVAEVLDIFGPDRCMYGSDWPVCLVAGRYADVIGALRTCLADLPAADQAQIFERSAIEAYRLPEFSA